MKKQTDHKTNWREIFTPCIAVFGGQGRSVAAWRCDANTLHEIMNNTLITQISPKDGFAHLRQTYFADWSPETGDFGRKPIPRE